MQGRKKDVTVPNSLNAELTRMRQNGELDELQEKYSKMVGSNNTVKLWLMEAVAEKAVRDGIVEVDDPDGEIFVTIAGGIQNVESDEDKERDSSGRFQ